MDYIFSSANPRIDAIYYVLAVIIALLLGAITRYFYLQGRISKAKSIAMVLLAVYIFLVFSSTVFSRTSGSDYNYELIPFWSYQEIRKGSKSLLWEDVLNVIMLLPVGIFLPVVMNDIEGSRKFRRVVLIGFLTSFTIEFLQLIMKRGLFEFDDMFHNTLGVMIGYLGYQKMKRRV